MGDDNEHSDMIPYVIAFLVGLVIINLVIRKGTRSFFDVIEKATGLEFK